MLSLAFDRGRDSEYRVLCLGAHSDDIEIGCGGTMLRLAATYPRLAVKWVVFSAEGERELEARESAALFLEHVTESDVVVKTFRNAYFPHEADRIKDFFEDLKGWSPDVVFTHCRHDAHQDHRVLCELAWNTWRNQLILEYEVPKYDGDLGNPDFFVRLDDATARRKVECLMRCFHSQQGRHWFTEDVFYGLMRLRGVACAERYAEGFYARKVVL